MTTHAFAAVPVLALLPVAAPWAVSTGDPLWPPFVLLVLAGIGWRPARAH